MKKALAFLLALVMMVSLLPTAALAEDDGPEITPVPVEESPVPAEEPTPVPEASEPAAPTAEPAAEPTVEPTEEPTAEPTVEPTEEPTAEPTVEPTAEPTVEPTAEPTVEPAANPAVAYAPVPLAYAVVASGTCGENLTWKLEDDGYLSISGTGAMYDFSLDSSGKTVPWEKCRGDIKYIYISYGGVTSIGNYAFYGCG